MGATLLFLALIFYVPFLTSIFRFEIPGPVIFPVSILAAIASVAFVEIVKIISIMRKRSDSGRGA
jgi:hypothetical protein